MPKTLLLLDDEEAHRMFALRALRAKLPGFVVIEASDIAGAQKQLEEHGRNFSIFLVDLNVGTESGLTLVTQIRKSPMLSSRPVLVLSTSELESDIEAAYVAGASAYLFKGTDMTLFGEHLVGAITFFLK